MNIEINYISTITCIVLKTISKTLLCFIFFKLNQISLDIKICIVFIIKSNVVISIPNLNFIQEIHEIVYVHYFLKGQKSTHFPPHFIILFTHIRSLIMLRESINY